MSILLRNAEPARADAASGTAPGEYVMVSVSDTGVGIAPEQLDRVFEPFYTTKEIGRGTGLGLSQVYGFVEQSGGRIHIESTVDIGTTVTIHLPKASGALVETDISNPPDEKATNGSETILLVEDDPGVLEVVTAMLEELGYRVLTAQNGPEALSLLSRGSRVDLLFTDMIMPHGLSGGQLAQQAWEMRPELKILLGSGYSATEPTSTAAAVKNLPLLRKPYRRDELAAKLRAVLA